MFQRVARRVDFNAFNHAVDRLIFVAGALSLMTSVALATASLLVA